MNQQAAGKPQGMPEHPEGLAQSLEELAAAFNNARKDNDEADAPRGGGGAGAAQAAPLQGNLEMVMRIPVTVQVVLGSASMPVANLVKLGRGAVVALDLARDRVTT